MKSLEYRFEVLKKILRKTYHEKEKPELSDRWRVNVMRRVGNIGPLQSKSDPLIQFGQFVWRLTPVTCLLIIVLTAVWLKYNVTLEHNLLVSLITDAEEFTISQLLPL
ncbi:hypothetical protein ACFLZM_04125 [Thermodesulfobacteriota bacterium]